MGVVEGGTKLGGDLRIHIWPFVRHKAGCGGEKTSECGNHSIQDESDGDQPGQRIVPKQPETCIVQI